MSAAPQDRGLSAVRRVRSVRENDSRIGLQHALAESRRRAEEAERALRAVQVSPAFVAGSVAEFLGHAQRLGALASASSAAEHAAATSLRVGEEATRRWQHDRTEVRVVDLLLERRAAERAAERERRTAAELDDLAAVGWQRRAAEAAHAQSENEEDR